MGEGFGLADGVVDVFFMSVFQSYASVEFFCSRGH